MVLVSHPVSTNNGRVLWRAQKLMHLNYETFCDQLGNSGKSVHVWISFADWGDWTPDRLEPK